MEYILCLLLFLLGINNSKSSHWGTSLTFVIENENSMADYIEELKNNSDALDAIFDTAMHSDQPLIEEIILITFNKSDVSLKTKTNDRETFKSALKNISALSYGDSAAMVMKGIELALYEGEGSSRVFVFTDTPLEFSKMAKVKDFARKTQIQIIFVVPHKTQSLSDYNDLASDTQGLVFQITKEETRNMLNYIKNTILDLYLIQVEQKYKEYTEYGTVRKYHVPVDEETKELIVFIGAIAGAITTATDSAGRYLHMRRPSWGNFDRIRLNKPENRVNVGFYGLRNESTLEIYGTTTMHFRYGFSAVEPTAITDTETAPVQGQTSYVSIKLYTELGKARLSSVQILTTDGQVVLERSLKKLNANEQLYVTTSRISPPDHVFRIAITGYHNEVQHLIKRTAITTILSKSPTESLSSGLPDGEPRQL